MTFSKFSKFVAQISLVVFLTLGAAIAVKAGAITVPPSGSSLDGSTMPSATLGTGDTTEAKVKSFVGTILKMARSVAIPLITLMIVILGVRMATSASEETARKLRDQLFLAIGGLVLITLAKPVVEILFGANGSSAPIWLNDAQKNLLASEMSGVINFFAYGMTAIAVGVIIFNSFFILMAEGNEDEFKNGRLGVVYAVVGLVVIALARVIVATFYGDWSSFADKDIATGADEIAPKLSDGIAELVGLVNFGLKFAGLATLVMLIYAGYLVIMGGGDEENQGRARKIITAAIVGLVVIISAYVVVNAFMPNI